MPIYSQNECVVFRKNKEKFGGFSNMYPAALRINSIEARTSEALYQAMKFPDAPEVQEAILSQKSPMTAKMVARKHQKLVRPDWLDINVYAMSVCVMLKIEQHRKLVDDLFEEVREAEEYLQTFYRILGYPEFQRIPIVEYSTKDTFWGAKFDGGYLVGENVLGRIWMAARPQIEKGLPISIEREPVSLVVLGQDLNQTK